jgi:hypothetical protein
MAVGGALAAGKTALAALGGGSALAGGLSVGMQGLSMAQVAKQGNQAAQQMEDQMREQRHLQNQQLKAQAKQNQQMMNTLKQVAKQNPTVAGAAAGQQMGVMQGNFSVPAGLVNAAKVAKGAVKDLAIVGKKVGAHKHIASGLALGATAAGASYLVDKAIQADAKRNGINLGNGDSEGRKESAKKIGKVAAIAGTAALATLGAKKGLLGKSIQGTANKYITKANAGKVGNTMKNAFKDQFVNSDKLKNAKTFKDKVKSVNGLGIAITAGLAATPAVGYVSSKKAMKDQINATEEQRSYAAVSAKSLKTVVPNLQKNAMKFVQKVKPAVSRAAINPSASSGPAVAKFKEAPVRNVLGRVSGFLGGGGQQGTAEFTEALRKQGAKSGNAVTQKAADFLGKHKTLAVAGSVGVGLAMMKPFEYSHGAVRTVTKAIDKNATKYEDSQNKTVD